MSGGFRADERRGDVAATDVFAQGATHLVGKVCFEQIGMGETLEQGMVFHVCTNLMVQA